MPLSGANLLRLVCYAAATHFLYEGVLDIRKLYYGTEPRAKLSWYLMGAVVTLVELLFAGSLYHVGTLL